MGLVLDVGIEVDEYVIRDKVFRKLRGFWVEWMYFCVFLIDIG